MQARAIDVQENRVLDFRAIMAHRLLILVFLLAVTGNSLAAVPAHLEADGGCSADCCRAARQNKPDSSIAKLCCMTQCNQPGGTGSQAPAISILSELRSKRSLALSRFSLEAVVLSRAAARFHSLILPASDSTSVYLRTGALLI